MQKNVSISLVNLENDKIPANPGIIYKFGRNNNSLDLNISLFSLSMISDQIYQIQLPDNLLLPSDVLTLYPGIFNDGF